MKRCILILMILIGSIIQAEPGSINFWMDGNGNAWEYDKEKGFGDQFMEDGKLIDKNGNKIDLFGEAEKENSPIKIASDKKVFYCAFKKSDVGYDDLGAFFKGNCTFVNYKGESDSFVGFKVRINQDDMIYTSDVTNDTKSFIIRGKYTGMILSYNTKEKEAYLLRDDIQELFVIEPFDDVKPYVGEIGASDVNILTGYQGYSTDGTPNKNNYSVAAGIMLFVVFSGVMYLLFKPGKGDEK